MKAKASDISLTEGPILPCLARFALPMMAGNLLQQVYNIVDTLIVGRCIGPDALAAVGSAYTMMIFITSVILGLCMGSGALWSQDWGAGDAQRLRSDLRHSFIFIFAVTLLLYCAIYPGMNLILKILQIPEELLELSRSYISVVFLGILFIFLYNFSAYALRALGNSVTPLVFLAVSSLLNVILDLWFVVGLEMGVAGAAWATVISQTVSGVGILTYAMGVYPMLNPLTLRGPLEGKRMEAVIRNDVFTGLQQSVMNFGILMIQGLVNSFGTTIMAAFAAAVKIDTLAYMPAQEFGNAYSLFISQNYGAGEKTRIRHGTQLSFQASGSFCLVISVVIFLFASQLMMAFVNAGEKDILAAGVHYLHIEGACYIGIGILFLWYGYFRAIARPQISLLLTVISLGTRVLLSYTLAFRFGVTAIWCSIPIGWFLADLAGYLIYKKFEIKAL